MSARQVLVFWGPLALMWLMMSMEGPLIAAAIARLPNPAFNLAAFQLTFALALLVESPVIMLLTAGTALGSRRSQVRRLLRFTAILAAAVTALHLVLALTPLYGLVVGGLMSAPLALVEPSRRAFLLMAAWSGAIAFRRLWQGVMIRFYHTRAVSATTVVRLLATVSVLLAGLVALRLPGASLGGLALSVGVTVAALAAYVLARPIMAREVPTAGDPPIAWMDLSRFYFPLALTSLIVLGGGAVITMGLGRSPDAITALAVWPVILGLTFLVRSGGYAYQEAVVALMERPDSERALRRFALGLALALGLVMALFAATPLGEAWMTDVAGLSPPLVAAALPPLVWLVPAPALTVLVSWHRGRLVHASSTPAVTWAVAANVAALTLVLAVGLWAMGPEAEGATLAGAAVTASLAVETAVLAWASHRGRGDTQAAGPSGRHPALVAR